MGVLRPSELIDHVIEVMGLQAHYLDGTPQGEARMENLNELRGLAESFDDRAPDQGLEDFLAEVALVSDVDAYDENGEGVTLITLHMVKGLEFPVVFMVGMEEGLLPHQRALDEREENPSAVGAATEMAEERRLCYVGMTRAKDRLYLSCAFRRHLYGRSQPAFPSRFLTEIPQSMLSAPRGSAPVAPPRQGYKERYQELQVQAAPGRAARPAVLERRPGVAPGLRQRHRGQEHAHAHRRGAGDQVRQGWPQDPVRNDRAADEMSKRKKVVDPALRSNELREQIRKHEHAYYVLDSPRSPTPSTTPCSWSCAGSRRSIRSWSPPTRPRSAWAARPRSSSPRCGTARRCSACRTPSTRTRSAPSTSGCARWWATRSRTAPS